MVQPVKYQPADTAVSPVSRLQRLWMNGDFAITAQFPPPLTSLADEFVAHVTTWATRFDALLTTDAPEGAIALSSLAMAVLLRRTGIETIAQMSGRDRNRLALQSDVLGLSILGIPNLLVDTRPMTRANLGQNSDARLVADLSGPTLLATVTRLRDEARFSSGASIKVPPVFYLGALVAPEAHLPVEELSAAQFLVTTPVHNTPDQLDTLASFCATHASFLQTRPLLVSLLLTTGIEPGTGEGSRHPSGVPVAIRSARTGTPLGCLLPSPRDVAHQDTVVETCVQSTLAAIEALKTCSGVRGCNIVVERLADLVLLERVALALQR